MNDRPLTEKQRAFAARYAETGNAAGSARDAGYSAKSAGKIGADLLKDDRIKRAIERARGAIIREVEEGAGVESADVLRGLYREATREGQGSTHAARVAAWRSIGEVLGMFRRPESPRGVAAVAAVRVTVVLPEHRAGGGVLPEASEVEVLAATG